jgi:hypothetical protein
MFFVFGSPRSGTTLLAQCLSAHPDVIVPDETDIIIPTAFMFDRLADPLIRRDVLKKFIVNTSRFPTSIGEFLSPAQVADIVDSHSERPDEFFEALYAAIADRAGARIAGDKSPNDLLFLRMLFKVGAISPKAKIIHIVRDVRDVVSSIGISKMTDAPERWFPRFWGTSNLYLWDLYHQSEQYRLVRYEEFVRAPDQTLQGLCAHLGLEYQRQMLNPDLRHSRYRTMVQHGKLFESISDKYVGAYRSVLPAPIIVVCETHAAEAIRTFGY